MARNAFINGTGSYVPPQAINNQEVSKILGEDVSEFMAILGIQERRIKAEHQSTVDLAYLAAVAALNDAKLSSEDIDVLILSTDTPDIISPASASAVAGKLKMRHDSYFFDINASCTGFVVGAELARSMIVANPNVNNVLLISAYCMTPFAPIDKGKFFAVFSDGAGACVFSAVEDEEKGYLASHFIGDGNEWSSLGIYVGGTRFLPTIKRLEGQGEVQPGLTFFQGELINRNPELWPEIIKKALTKTAITLLDIDLFIFTQINLSAVHLTCANLGIDFKQTHNIMDKYGYTGNACIIMALDDARQKGRIKNNDIVCLTASGVGYTMGSILFKM